MSSPSVKITLHNAAELAAAFRLAPARLTREVHTAIQRSILVIENKTKREAPVNKGGAGGNLRQSIRSSMRGTATGLVEVGADYGVFVEEGTKPHIIMPKNARVLASRTSGTRGGGEYRFFGREVHHPGTQANPFFARGIKNSMPDVDRYFEMAVINTLKSL